MSMLLRTTALLLLSVAIAMPAVGLGSIDRPDPDGSPTATAQGEEQEARVLADGGSTPRAPLGEVGHDGWIEGEAEEADEAESAVRSRSALEAPRRVRLALPIDGLRRAESIFETRSARAPPRA